MVDVISTNATYFIIVKLVELSCSRQYSTARAKLEFDTTLRAIILSHSRGPERSKRSFLN